MRSVSETLGTVGFGLSALAYLPRVTIWSMNRLSATQMMTPNECRHWLSSYAPTKSPPRSPFP